MTYQNYRDLMTVSVPVGTRNAVSISRFDISKEDVSFAMMKGGMRFYTPPGTYTRLDRNGELWMSDTHAEMADHYGPVERARSLTDNRRVLITGLGIGMVVQAMILLPDPQHIDVVEIDRNVIDLVGPHYEKLAAEHGKTLTIHHGDAYDRKALFGKDDRWAVVWHDVWLDVCTDNWDGMKALRRSYGRYAEWQGCWSDKTTKRLIEEDKRYRKHLTYWRNP